jgi:hypothetical protein
MNNEKQSLNFVLEMRQRFNQPKFFIEFGEIFDNFLDSQDPDLNNMFLFAEEAFKDKKPVWYVLTVLIANFGKMLIFHLKSKEDAHIFEAINKKPAYLVAYGVIQKSLDDCIYSYGYGEYLYNLLLNSLNKNSLPLEALQLIRYKDADINESEHSNIVQFRTYFEVKENKLNFDKMKKKYIPLLKLYFENNGLYM